MKELAMKLIPDSIGKDIEKACKALYPLQDVYIRKVKVLKKPKFELGRLLELHYGNDGAAAITGVGGSALDRPGI